MLAAFLLTLAEGMNFEEGLAEGSNILNQLFGGQDDCDGGYKCPNGECCLTAQVRIPTCHLRAATCSL